VTLQLNTRQMAAARRLLANSSNPFDGAGVSRWWGGTFSSGENAKHNLYYDFGYPRFDELTFYHFYNTYRRNGIARALVEKTAGKTWQDAPCLRETSDLSADETQLEADVRQRLDDIRFWQALRETDARSMVGKYAGLIFQLADGKAYDQPVDRVPGGLDGIISVLPAWEGQLEPSSWDLDPASPAYGKPSMFRFNESSVDPETGKVRSFTVHPDRVLVWSKDGTTWGESRLEACYNALLDMEKVRGAGGEGFWKNAKSQPILQAEKDIDFNQLAAMLGTDIAGLPDALDDVVARWSKGFDQSMVTQGIDVKTLGVTLPQPEEFFNVALQEVAASWPIPQKILVGMQTGERASTEDAREWAQTNMSRRSGMVVPNILDIVRRFEQWGILPERDWFVDWADLTAPTLDEKLAIGEKMAKINSHMFATGEAVFTDEEIRRVAGYEAAPDEVLSEVIDDA